MTKKNTYPPRKKYILTPIDNERDDWVVPIESNENRDLIDTKVRRFFNGQFPKEQTEITDFTEPRITDIEDELWKFRRKYHLFTSIKTKLESIRGISTVKFIPFFADVEKQTSLYPNSYYIIIQLEHDIHNRGEYALEESLQSIGRSIWNKLSETKIPFDSDVSMKPQPIDYDNLIYDGHVYFIKIRPE